MHADCAYWRPTGETLTREESGYLAVRYAVASCPVNPVAPSTSTSYAGAGPVGTIHAFGCRREKGKGGGSSSRGGDYVSSLLLDGGACLPGPRMAESTGQTWLDSFHGEAIWPAHPLPPVELYAEDLEQRVCKLKVPSALPRARQWARAHLVRRMGTGGAGLGAGMRVHAPDYRAAGPGRALAGARERVLTRHHLPLRWPAGLSAGAPAVRNRGWPRGGARTRCVAQRGGEWERVWRRPS